MDIQLLFNADKLDKYVKEVISTNNLLGIAGGIDYEIESNEVKHRINIDTTGKKQSPIRYIMNCKQDIMELKIPLNIFSETTVDLGKYTVDKMYIQPARKSILGNVELAGKGRINELHISLDNLEDLWIDFDKIDIDISNLVVYSTSNSVQGILIRHLIQSFRWINHCIYLEYPIIAKDSAEMNFWRQSKGTLPKEIRDKLQPSKRKTEEAKRYNEYLEEQDWEGLANYLDDITEGSVNNIHIRRLRQ